MNTKSALSIAVFLVLLASTLLGLQPQSFAADAQAILAYIGVSIQSPNGSYPAPTPIPLNVNVELVYGTTTRSSNELSGQDVICKYSLDNSEWKDIPFIEVTSTTSQPDLNFPFINIINCTYSTVLQGLSEGLHFINVTTYPDTAVHLLMGPSRVNFTVYGPLSISVLSPQNKTYSTKSLPLNFMVTQPTSWISYSLDGQENVTISGNTTLTGLPDGPHSVTVYAKDVAGNTGASETISFSVKIPFSAVPVATASAASAAIIGIGLLVYFKKRKR
jgi:hypothetical protein